MAGLWRTIRGYIWWAYPRGSVHYDIMVTLILLFIFVTPHFLNFKDKPVERTPHQTGVVVLPDGKQGFVYQIDAAAVSGTDDAAIREDLTRVIEPIAGEVEIAGYETVRDNKGRAVAYRVHVQR